MNAAPATMPTASDLRGWFARAETWLDNRGRGAWIASTVFAFVLFWPVGLALLGYALVTKRLSRGDGARPRVVAGSGNSAFDAYKADTLRRLEDEQAAFEDFLRRLRESKDKAEFDQFMDERGRKARDGERTEDRADDRLDDRAEAA